MAKEVGGRSAAAAGASRVNGGGGSWPGVVGACFLLLPFRAVRTSEGLVKLRAGTGHSLSFSSVILGRRRRKEDGRARQESSRL